MNNKPMILIDVTTEVESDELCSCAGYGDSCYVSKYTDSSVHELFSQLSMWHGHTDVKEINGTTFYYYETDCKNRTIFNTPMFTKITQHCETHICKNPDNLLNMYRQLC